jgi:hypothetical protein
MIKWAKCIVCNNPGILCQGLLNGRLEVVQATRCRAHYERGCGGLDSSHRAWQQDLRGFWQPGWEREVSDAQRAAAARAREGRQRPVVSVFNGLQAVSRLPGPEGA